MQTNYIIQVVFGIVLMIFFLYRSVNVSQLFSTTLSLKNRYKPSKKEIFNQLIFIWFFPLIVLLAIVLYLVSFNPGQSFVFIFGSMLLLLIINAFVMLKYDHIVN